jgi:O-antigen ligase
MRFTLFLVANGVLILRPTEIIPAWKDLPIYNIVIVMAILASASQIADQLSRRSLASRPISACVLGLLIAIMLSHVANGHVRITLGYGVEFLKVVLYYLLLVANLRSDRHIRLFLLTTCGMMMVHVGLAELDYYGQIDLAAFTPYREHELDPISGSVIGYHERLRGAGIFNDPNELCMLMVIGACIAVYLLQDREFGPLRFAAVAPLGVFLSAIPLTHSRGGILALFGAMSVQGVFLLGAKRGMLLLGLMVPAIIVAIGGRMTSFDLDNPNETGQSRVRLWSDGLVAARSAPLFGIGAGKFEDLTGHVAHNSYIEAYCETGFLGGTLFTGAFVYAVWALIRVGRRYQEREVSFARLRCMLLSIVVAQMVGMLSLSRGYVPPTYLVLGLVTAYLSLAAARAPSLVPVLTTNLAIGWVALSALLLAAMNVGTGQLVQWR